MIQFQAFLNHSLDMSSNFVSCSSRFAVSIGLLIGQKNIWIPEPVWTLWCKVSAPPVILRSSGLFLSHYSVWATPVRGRTQIHRKQNNYENISVSERTDNTNLKKYMAKRNRIKYKRLVRDVWSLYNHVTVCPVKIRNIYIFFLNLEDDERQERRGYSGTRIL
jgi:hypothetical protein